MFKKTGQSGLKFQKQNCNSSATIIIKFKWDGYVRCQARIREVESVLNGLEPKCVLSVAISVFLRIYKKSIFRVHSVTVANGINEKLIDVELL